MKKKVERMVKKEETITCCDRCGEQIESSYEPGFVCGQIYNRRISTKIIRKEEYEKPDDDTGGCRSFEYDLCDKCYNDFSRWLLKPPVRGKEILIDSIKLKLTAKRKK